MLARLLGRQGPQAWGWTSEGLNSTSFNLWGRGSVQGDGLWQLSSLLRLMSAEAVPRDGQRPVDQESDMQQAQERVDGQDAAKYAYSELVSTILRQAAANQRQGCYGEDGGGGDMPFEFEGLHLMEEQQQGFMYGEGDEGKDVLSSPSHVQRSLAAIRYHQSLMDGTPKGRRLQKNWQRQITLETRAVDAAIARYKREAESANRRGAAATLPPARKLLVGWFKPLAEAIKEEQYHIAHGTPGIDRSVYGPYLLQLDPEQLAVITMHAAMNCFMSPENEGDAVGARPGATRMTKLSTAIGKAVEAQHHIDRLEDAVHKQNMKVKEIRNIYDEGRSLRMKYETDGRLNSLEWKEWLEIGNRLRDLGEMLPLDHLEWFKVSNAFQNWMK